MSRTLLKPDGRTTCCDAFSSIGDLGEYCKACYEGVEGYLGDAVFAMPTTVTLPPVGIPYAAAEVVDGVLYRRCPVCDHLVSEMTAADGEQTSNYYAGHFSALHTIPTQPKPSEEDTMTTTTTRKKAPAKKATTTTPLPPGALGTMVASYLAAHPDEAHGPVSIGTALGGKSSGAVRNACDRLVTNGAATLVSEKPRRYQHVRQAAKKAAAKKTTAAKPPAAKRPAKKAPAKKTSSVTKAKKAAAAKLERQREDAAFMEHAVSMEAKRVAQWAAAGSHGDRPKTPHTDYLAEKEALANA